MAAQFLESAPDYGDYGVPDNNSDIIIDGDWTTLPTIGDTPQYPGDGGFSMAGIKDVLGNIPKVARDVGTIVGTIQKDIKTAPIVYNQAKTNAVKGNSIAQWWQYSSQNDKLMLGVALVGLYLALK